MLIQFRCCNTLPQAIGLKQYSFIILHYSRSEVQNGSHWANTSVGRAALLSGGSREKSISLPIPASRSHVHSLACGLLPCDLKDLQLLAIKTWTYLEGHYPAYHPLQFPWKWDFQIKKKTNWSHLCLSPSLLSFKHFKAPCYWYENKNPLTWCPFKVQQGLAPPSLIFPRVTFTVFVSATLVLLWMWDLTYTCLFSKPWNLLSSNTALHRNFYLFFCLHQASPPDRSLH